MLSSARYFSPRSGIRNELPDVNRAINQLKKSKCHIQKVYIQLLFDICVLQNQELNFKELKLEITLTGAEQDYNAEITSKMQQLIRTFHPSTTYQYRIKDALISYCPQYGTILQKVEI